jgi:hypothetical protein
VEDSWLSGATPARGPCARTRRTVRSVKGIEKVLFDFDRIPMVSQVVNGS